MKRTINTNLAKKKDLFDVLALSEAIGLPVLLIGDPGVAKTKAVTDYAETALGELSNNDIFLLETDEGTRSNAVKGNIDLEALTTQNKYQVVSPIAEAKFVVINEIDKASASLRNSLLGVMNEKYIFNGTEKKKCVWDAFVATCNEIPEDEADSPFWDRFAITFRVDRLREADMLDYFANGGRNSMQKYTINLPEPGEVEANLKALDVKKIKKVMDLTYSKLSDRTLSYVPTLVANIMAVYTTNQDRAFVKAVELLVGKTDADILAKSIMSRELRALYDKVDMIASCTTDTQYRKLMNEVNTMGEDLKAQGILKAEDEKDVINRAVEAQDSLAFLSNETEESEVYDNLNDSSL
jgi:MoxR-like ATPase